MHPYLSVRPEERFLQTLAVTEEARIKQVERRRRQAGREAPGLAHHSGWWYLR